MAERSETDPSKSSGTPAGRNTPTRPDPPDGLESPAPREKLQPAASRASADTGAETEVWAGRTHWKHYAGPLLIWLSGSVVGAGLLVGLASSVEWLTARGAAVVIVALFILTGVLVCGRVALAVLNHRYRLTTQRLFVERGVFSRTIDQTELIRVDDVRIKKSLLDRIFGLGSVAVMSTDASHRDAVIEGIADPEFVAEAIRTHMRTLRRQSLFVEKL